MRKGVLIPMKAPLKGRVISIFIILLLSLSSLIFLSANALQSQSFYQGVRVDDDPETVDDTFPDIVAYNGTVWVIYVDGRNGDTDIRIANSTDGGLSFNPSVRVDDTDRDSDPAGGNTDQLNPSLCVDTKGNLYAFWEDHRAGNSDVYFSRSNDGGNSWSDNVRVDDSGNWGIHNPRADVDEQGNIYVVWSDERNSNPLTQDDIYFTMSTNGGQSFMTPSIHVDDAGPGYLKQRYPDVVVDSEQRIYVAWEDERIGDFDIYGSVSLDGGLSFESNLMISDDLSNGYQFAPRLEVSDDRVLCVWYDARSGNKDIYSSISLDNGTSWEPNNRVDSASGTVGATFPAVSLGPNGKFYIAWQDARNGTSIYMTWTDDGTTFYPDVQVTDLEWSTEADQLSPAIACDEFGTIHCAYQDDRLSDKFNIFYSRSIMGGQPGQGPALGSPELSPQIGNSETDFYFRIVYTDIDNDPPAEGFPKLYVDTLINDVWEPYPISPFNMTWQLYPVQDMDHTNGEKYEIKVNLEKEFPYRYQFKTRAQKGNTSMVETPYYYGPILDTTPVQFSNFTPTEDKFLSSLIVPIGIDISDGNGTGVDASTVQYSISTSGSKEEDFSRWYTGGLKVDNSSMRFQKNITFKNGTDNYIRFRAMDLMGNGDGEDGYQRSDTYQIKIDPMPPEFVDPLPGSTEVLKYNAEVPCFITVTDQGGIGVDPTTVEFSISLYGPEDEDFGPWMPVLLENITMLEANNQSFKCRINQDLLNGTDNYIRWRAADFIGNTQESDEFQISIHLPVEQVKNHRPTPPTELLPEEVNDLSPHLQWTGAMDADGDALIYYLQIGIAPDAGDIVPWFSTGANSFYDVPEDLNLTYGTYYVQIRASDGQLNSSIFQSTIILNSSANSPPIPPTSNSPNITGNRFPRISWSGAYDPDGDTLVYFVQVGTTQGGSEILAWYSTVTRDYVDITEYLSSRTYYVQVLCSDGKSFSSIYEGVMEVGYYALDVSFQDKVTLHPGKSSQYRINVTNKGVKTDTIMLRLGGEASGYKNLTITLLQTEITLNPDQSGYVYVNFTVEENTLSDSIKLEIIAESKDSETKDMFECNVIIYNPDTADDDIVPDDDVVPDDDDDDDDVEVHSDVYHLGFYIIMLLVVLVVGVVTYIIRLNILKKRFDEPDENPVVEDHKFDDRKYDDEDLDDDYDDDYDEIDIDDDDIDDHDERGRSSTRQRRRNFDDHDIDDHDERGRSSTRQRRRNFDDHDIDDHDERGRSSTRQSRASQSESRRNRGTRSSISRRNFDDHDIDEGGR